MINFWFRSCGIMMVVLLQKSMVQDVCDVGPHEYGCDYLDIPKVPSLAVVCQIRKSPQDHIKEFSGSDSSPGQDKKTWSLMKKRIFVGGSTTTWETCLPVASSLATGLPAEGECRFGLNRADTTLEYAFYGWNSSTARNCTTPTKSFAVQSCSKVLTASPTACNAAYEGNSSSVLLTWTMTRTLFLKMWCNASPSRFLYNVRLTSLLDEDSVGSDNIISFSTNHSGTSYFLFYNHSVGLIPPGEYVYSIRSRLEGSVSGWSQSCSDRAFIGDALAVGAERIYTEQGSVDILVIVLPIVGFAAVLVLLVGFTIHYRHECKRMVIRHPSVTGLEAENGSVSDRHLFDSPSLLYAKMVLAEENTSSISNPSVGQSSSHSLISDYVKAGQGQADGLNASNDKRRSSNGNTSNLGSLYRRGDGENFRSVHHHGDDSAASDHAGMDTGDDQRSIGSRYSEGEPRGSCLNSESIGAGAAEVAQKSFTYCPLQFVTQAEPQENESLVSSSFDDSENFGSLVSVDESL